MYWKKHRPLLVCFNEKKKEEDLYSKLEDPRTS